METKKQKKQSSEKEKFSLIGTFREVLGALGSPEKNVIYRVRGGVDKPFLIIVLLLICFGSVMVSKGKPRVILRYAPS